MSGTAKAKSILISMESDTEQDGSAPEQPRESGAAPGSLATNALRALRAGRTDAPARTADTASIDASEPDAESAETTAVADTEVADTQVGPQDAPTAEIAATAAVDRATTPAGRTSADRKSTAAKSTGTKSTGTKSTGTKSTGTKSTAPEPSLPRSARRRSGAAARPEAARTRSRLTLVLAGTAALALAFVVVAGVLWHQAGHNDARTRAAARDAVALDARLDIDAVNTSDYHDAPAALTKWLSVSTGTLHDQFAQTRAKAVSLLKQAKIVTSATVLDAAVTELNNGKGTATVIASVDVRKQPVKGAAATQRNRFSASMVRVGGTWKLNDLSLVSVQLS